MEYVLINKIFNDRAYFINGGAFSMREQVNNYSADGIVFEKTQIKLVVTAESHWINEAKVHTYKFDSD